MRRRMTVASLTLAMALALAVPAGAGVPDNDYQGRAEHDHGTYVGFDLTQKSGKTSVSNVVAVLPYHCAGDSPTFATSTKGSLKVDSNKRFKGTLKIPLDARGDATSAHIELSGKLAKHGKANGIIQGVVVFAGAPRGGTTRCYTGGLTYSIKKGAHVSMPITRADGRLR